MNHHHEEIITALLNCALACDNCFDGCLKEKEIDMLADCIRLDKDCAAMCRITASFIASGSDYAGELVDICSDVCSGCARECEKHKHDHCRICAEACRKCEEACESFAPSTV
jgi:hypothetical protein